MSDSIFFRSPIFGDRRFTHSEQAAEQRARAKVAVRNAAALTGHKRPVNVDEDRQGVNATSCRQGSPWNSGSRDEANQSACNWNNTFNSTARDCRTNSFSSVLLQPRTLRSSRWSRFQPVHEGPSRARESGMRRQKARPKPIGQILLH